MGSFRDHVGALEGERNGVGYLRPAGAFLLAAVSVGTTLFFAGVGVLSSLGGAVVIGVLFAAWAAVGARDPRGG